MEILGHYSNGAKLVRDNARDYSPYQQYFSEYIAYDDCQTCDGSGYILQDKSGMYVFGREKGRVQCPACALRFGKKDALRARVEEIQKLVKGELRHATYKVIADNRLTREAFAFAEDYNVNNPLAKEYRLCLYRMWAYTESEFYDEQGNLQEQEDRWIGHEDRSIGDWAFRS